MALLLYDSSCGRANMAHIGTIIIGQSTFTCRGMDAGSTERLYSRQGYVAHRPRSRLPTTSTLPSGTIPRQRAVRLLSLSMVQKIIPTFSPTTLGCFSTSRCASVSSRKCDSLALARGMIFTATTSPVALSVAFDTEPNCPWPNVASPLWRE